MRDENIQQAAASSHSSTNADGIRTDVRGVFHKQLGALVSRALQLFLLASGARPA